MTYEHTPVTVEGKRAVVIGGTSGIGRAIARGFAADGANVAATSRTADAVAETAAELRDLGAETVEATCDVTDRGSIVACRDAVVDDLGGVDVLVNSQSYVSRASLSDGDEEDWQRVFDVQLDGTYRATQVFAERMDEGAILNVSSISNQLAIPDLVPYTTAKGGVDAFTRVAAKELGPEIRVNAIKPGFVRSEQTAGTYDEDTDRYREIARRTVHERMADPEELVGAAIYLASDAASYTTGSVLTVDDGFTADAFGNVSSD
ncbi:SDR family NAD(P)-dependent oxidoreductase [Haloplanus halophilus]|uniref:SDR family NAD(P)-dependent oxidoreductase n=1 Tax=Haloplanus halophilus TaxID=2949993 RepID=UPI0020417662|nr:SDR family oxidoreductase [Haloplanus sp. GDY1]